MLIQYPSVQLRYVQRQLDRNGYFSTTRHYFLYTCSLAFRSQILAAQLQTRLHGWIAPAAQPQVLHQIQQSYAVQHYFMACHRISVVPNNRFKSFEAMVAMDKHTPILRYHDLSLFRHDFMLSSVHCVLTNF